jgi:hypothetical protein
MLLKLQNQEILKYKLFRYSIFFRILNINYLTMLRN